MANILIIDDDVTQLDMFQAVFKMAGFVVETADSGENGIAMARKNKPDVILLDIVMPKMSGIECLQKLKLEPTLGQVPFVAMTNLTKPGLEEEVLAAGATKLILKANNTPREMVDIINKILATT